MRSVTKKELVGNIRSLSGQSHA
jgi:hypothetical protein